MNLLEVNLCFIANVKTFNWNVVDNKNGELGV